MSESTSRLFEPIQLGRLTLQHRVVMPALTRNRTNKKTRVVGDDIAEHYALRATIPGTLLIAECTFITPKDAAIKIWQSHQGSIAAVRGDPSWTVALTYVGLAFMSASLGLQGILGKRLNTQFTTTSAFSAFS